MLTVGASWTNYLLRSTKLRCDDAGRSLFQNLEIFSKVETDLICQSAFVNLTKRTRRA